MEASRLLFVSLAQLSPHLLLTPLCPSSLPRTPSHPADGTNFNGLPCVWGIAAGCAVSALVFQIINVIILWFGMSSDLGVSFSFKSSGGGADAFAPLGGASFQGSFQAGGEGTAPAPSSAGGYSGFGSGEL